MDGKCLFFGFWLCLCTTIGWGQRVIDLPEYESTNALTLDVLKVEIGDDVTVVSMQLSRQPGTWFRILARTVLRETNGDKVYKLLRADGIELDKQEIMPDSGSVVFRLYFEPLSLGVNQVDYWEGNGEGDWQIKGIRVTDKPRPEMDENTCVIRGEVIGRPDSHWVVMWEREVDYLFEDHAIIIPVREGKFEYVCQVKEPKVYELLFKDEITKGRFNPNIIFVEPGHIDVTLYPREEAAKNRVGGSPLNKLYQDYQDQIDEKFTLNRYWQQFDSLSHAGLYYTPKAMALYKEIRESENDQHKCDSLINISLAWSKTGEDVTPMQKAVKRQHDSAYLKMQRWKEDYMENSPSLVAYYLMLQDLKTASQVQLHTPPREVAYRFWQDTLRLMRLYTDVYQPKFPDHSYTKLVGSIVNSFNLIKIGGHYIDFTAPDLEGNDVVLSRKIEGKVALIDLWASWCGSCRVMSKSFIPVYEKYKSKGFVVVGVARERDVRDAKVAVAKDGYPWLNLVDLDDRGGIWAKYCLANAGGGLFLVDSTGRIMAIDPTAEEVDHVLEQLLK